MKKIFSLIISALMIAPTAGTFAFAEEDATVIFHADSINGTRWADTVVVYRGIENDGQNQWGENLVVDSNGIVTAKIPGGDMAGKNLAVPEGGMIVTGTGDIGRELYNSAEIGYHIEFDDYTMNIFIAPKKVNPFYEYKLTATGRNSTRWSGTVIIYDSGATTGTNIYGYEVCVDKNGVVVSAGGNDSAIPEGGYVISATEQADIRTLKIYFAVGARCVRDGLNISVKYDESCLKATVENEMTLLDADIASAKRELRLVDYDDIAKRSKLLSADRVKTLDDRAEIMSEIKDIRLRLAEPYSTEVRAVWYTPVETTAEEISAVVREMKDAGLNELVLASSNSEGSFIPQTAESPFKSAPIASRLDIIREYITACHENGMRFTLMFSVMGNKFSQEHADWLNINNDGGNGEELFLSPANAEYRKAFFDHVAYVLKYYDIDGIQLDYIRYPYFDGVTDAGYDSATIKLFEEKTGLDESTVREIGEKLYSHPQWGTWWNFKTELINDWVKGIYALTAELRPDVYVTAAVAASNGVNGYCQDANAWMDGGYIDGIYVMSYSEGITEQIVSRFAPSIEGEHGAVVMGCGAYLSLSEQDVVLQTAASGTYCADGTSYFEWSAYKAHGFADLLKGGLFASPASHFFSDAGDAVPELLRLAGRRFALYDSLNETDLSAVLSVLGTNPDKTAIESAISKAESAVNGDGVDFRFLTRDLNRAIRVINTAKPSFDRAEHYGSPDDDENSNVSGAELNSCVDYSVNLPADSLDNPTQNPAKTNPAPFVIAVLAVVAVAVTAVFVAKKRKSKK